VSQPIKGTMRLRWANGDGGSVKLPSVAGVPLGQHAYVWIDPGKMALLLTRVKGGWSTRHWGTQPKVCLILTRIKGGWSTTWRPPSPGGAL
jgi:hypothetical protein